MSRHIIISLNILIVLSISVPSPGWSADNPVAERVKKPVQKAIDLRQETQKAQEQWHEERQRLVDAFEHLQQEHEQLQEQKRHLEEVKASTQVRIAEKERQLTDIEQISVQIQPFLNELIARLRQEITDDMSFLSHERGQRLHRLDQLMTDPDVAISEKFRKITEALMVEAEYGRTIEVYQETIHADNRDILVNIFRLGRISLFYQTLDQEGCGFYNVAAGAWHPLPHSYNQTIQTAMDIGAKRRPVEMLSLPIGRMVVK